MTVIPYRWGSPIISKVSVSESQLNPHERQSHKEVETGHCLFKDHWYLCSLSDAIPMSRSRVQIVRLFVEVRVQFGINKHE